MITQEELKNKKVLVIVESPNKVTSIANILKTLGYNNIKVMATVGHTTAIKDNRASYKNTGIYPDENFKADYYVVQDKIKVVNNIRAQAAVSDLVLIATDPDREGENIGYHIKNLLGLKDNQYFRIKYHSVTKEAINSALNNLGKLDLNLCDAAETRQILDKLVGYSLSPVAKKYVGAKSVGRCQSAGLKLIVDREKEITDFKSETYIELYLSFLKNHIEYKAKYIGTTDKNIDKFSSAAQVKQIKDLCESGQYKVQEVTTKNRQENAKLPFCTATFQQEAASKLGLKIKDAMSIAQKLFEGITINKEHVGLITYHRTDSTDMATDFLPIIKDFVISAYGNVYNIPRVSKKLGTDQDGHECIRCTNPMLTPDKLAKLISNDLLVKVYKLIWQRTIASVLPSAIYTDTTYTIINNEQKFNLTTTRLTSAGFKEVYNYIDETEVDTNSNLILAQNEIIEDGSLVDVIKTTTPPARYKEASFIRELQKQAIGRPSTYASIVETVLSQVRNYCTLENKFIVPTNLGIQLSNFLDRDYCNIININYTKNMEAGLDLIAENKLQKLTFLNSFFSDLTETIKNHEQQDTEQVVTACPLCGAAMVIRRSRFGKLFYGCSTYPKCKGILNM